MHRQFLPKHLNVWTGPFTMNTNASDPVARSSGCNQSKRHIRTTENELKHMEPDKNANFKEKMDYEKEIEGMLQANAQQQVALLGTTSLHLLQEMDQRNSELLSVVIKFDDRQKVNIFVRRRVDKLDTDGFHSNSPIFL